MRLKVPKYKLLETGPWDESIEEDGIEFHSKWNHTSEWDKGGYNLNWIAEDAAEYFYDECDGYEGWNGGVAREFEIYTEENKYLGSFSIFLDFEPTFSAVRIKKDGKDHQKSV
jgi:hypothetical protein